MKSLVAAIPIELESLNRQVVANQTAPSAVAAVAQLAVVAAILTVVAETVAVAVEVIAAATALAAVAAPAEFEPATDQHKEDKSSELAIAASPLSKLAHQIWLQLLPSRQ